jgi:hypothetical protein
MAPTRRREACFEALTGGGLATNVADERVPLRIGVEVGEQLPHAFGRGIDLDLGIQLLH